MAKQKTLVTVETESGPVKGDQRTTNLGRNYYNFQGIPYMKQPVGKLRFRDPQSPDQWSTPFDATQEPPTYVELNYLNNFQLRGQEDAGVINVYTPYINPLKLLAVMVFIHGGGFLMGSGNPDMYGPGYFLQQDVVLVTFNYRLGPVGFLSLNDSTLGVPGNAGLKDQNLALKWVQKNIRNFGGNPNNVTVFGESAGAASTHFHMISDQSRGLFQRAILMSGSSFCKVWSLTPPKNWAARLAGKIGYNGSGTDADILDFLENASILDIIYGTLEVTTYDESVYEQIMFSYGPVVEPYITNNTFISKDPVLMARNAWSKDIDLLIGGTSMEGLIADFGAYGFYWSELVQSPNYLIPSELNLDPNSALAAELGAKIKQDYFGSKEISRIDYYYYKTDYLFWHGIQRTIKSRFNSGGTGKNFLYRLDADTNLNVFKDFYLNDVHISGCSHLDYIFYIFETSYTVAPGIQSVEFKIIKDMVSIWTNFAKFSDPNLVGMSWLPLTTSALMCMNIGNDESTFIVSPESNRVHTLNEVYISAGVPLY